MGGGKGAIAPPDQLDIDLSQVGSLCPNITILPPPGFSDLPAVLLFGTLCSFVLITLILNLIRMKRLSQRTEILYEGTFIVSFIGTFSRRL